jgi:RNase H.
MGSQSWGVEDDIQMSFLPLLSYGISVWEQALEKEHNRRKIKTVQRLINIKITKAFRTISHESFCILTGLPPVITKLQETAELYKIKKVGTYLNYEIEVPVNHNTWPHPAGFPGIRPANDDRQNVWKIYTDGSKMDNRVGSGIVMFQDEEIKHRLRYRLDKKYSNNQAEMLAILKATEKIHELDAERKQQQQQQNSSHLYRQ